MTGKYNELTFLEDDLHKFYEHIEGFEKKYPDVMGKIFIKGEVVPEKMKSKKDFENLWRIRVWSNYFTDIVETMKRLKPIDFTFEYAGALQGCASYKRPIVKIKEKNRGLKWPGRWLRKASEKHTVEIGRSFYSADILTGEKLREPENHDWAKIVFYTQ